MGGGFMSFPECQMVAVCYVVPDTPRTSEEIGHDQLQERGRKASSNFRDVLAPTTSSGSSSSRRTLHPSHHDLGVQSGWAQAKQCRRVGTRSTKAGNSWRSPWVAAIMGDVVE